MSSKDPTEVDFLALHADPVDLDTDIEGDVALSFKPREVLASQNEAGGVQALAARPNWVALKTVFPVRLQDQDNHLCVGQWRNTLRSSASKSGPHNVI